MALVDVLIPAYNAAGSLGRAVRSLQAQTLPDWRAVVVDDGSTDGTSEAAQGFGEKRLHLVRSARNLGRGRARALGLSQCSAPYVALLDADDWCLPERLERLAGALEAEPELSYAASASVVVGQDGHAAGRRGPDRGEMLPAGWEWEAARLFHPTLCLRRSVFQRAAYTPSRYAEDYFFMLRLCRAFDGRTLGEALYVYEEGTSQTAWKYTRNSLEVARVYWGEPAPLGRRLRAVAGAGAKIAAYNLIALFGLQKRLLREQTQPLDEQTRARVERLRREFVAPTLRETEPA
jgi:glycosyltransferase involved in cell wall biosynthesis